MKQLSRFLYRHNELLIWSAALVFLYFANDSGESHFSFCLFKWMGFTHCPGCGIGHSIHAAMHFDLVKAWQYHPLGVPALAIIIFRITQLIKQHTHGTHFTKLVTDHS